MNICSENTCKRLFLGLCKMSSSSITYQIAASWLRLRISTVLRIASLCCITLLMQVIQEHLYKLDCRASLAMTNPRHCARLWKAVAVYYWVCGGA